MLQKIGVVILRWLLLSGSGSAQQAEPEEESAELQIQQLIDGLELEDMEQLYRWSEPLFEGESLKESLMELSRYGLQNLSQEQILDVLWEGLKEGIAQYWRPVGQMLVIVLISGIFRHLQLQQDSASAMADWMAYLLCCVLAAWILGECVGQVKSASVQMGEAIEDVTPVLTVLLTAMGSLQTSTVLSPLMAGLTGGIFHIVNKLVIPAILVKSILDLGTGMNSLIRLDGISKLIGSLVKWLLGILFVVFLGVTALKGIAGASLDGVYFKAAKFTIDKTVPIIGGMFSDTLDTLMACGAVVKNSVGIVGLLSMTMLLLEPLCGLMSYMFLMKIAAAAAGLFGGQGTSQMLERMSEAVKLLLAALLCMLLMAFIFFAVMMGTADAGLMLR